MDLATSATSASSNTTLTTAEQDVPGCTYTTTRAGVYLALASFYFSVTASGVGFCVGYGYFNGSDAGQRALFEPATTGSTVVSQSWIQTMGASEVIKLRARKSGSSGTAVIASPHTTLRVVQIG